jgi:hypothetical protein
MTGVPPVFCAAPGPPDTLSRAMEPTAVIARVAIVALPLLVAVVLHEVAHGVVAYRCGDPTAVPGPGGSR